MFARCVRRGDLSRQELAGYLQISRGSYTNYEIGARGIPAEVFIKLADYYNVSVDYLMGRTKNPKKEEVKPDRGKTCPV